MCRYLKQRANRFCGAYNYGLNFVRSAYLANMANGEWFRHVRELSRAGTTVVDKWKIIKCPDCGLAYVSDPSIKVCHHCLKGQKSPKPIQKAWHHTRKQCAECGRIFIDETKSLKQKYCSSECRKEAQRKKSAELYRRKQERLRNAEIGECTEDSGNQSNRRCG